MKLHGINEPEEFLLKMSEKSPNGDADGSKRYKCATCPYITNSKSQYLYHKQFHKPRGGQYTCSYCSYNVSKRHLLHQHLKVHGINMSLQKQNGDVIDLDEISDEIEEIRDGPTFPDIPLVWVSKNGKFSKMFKCRFCPHVNLRKVNIQEHEKMHGIREKNRNNELEHHCSECNYVCNNAGVLSSHSKVHQGLYGTVHCLVDPTRSDEEQINELSRFINTSEPHLVDTINLDDEYDNVEDFSEELPDDAMEESMLYFCPNCPARFLKGNEFQIHLKFHGVRLFYKCDYCSYTARQKPHLLAHEKVHTQNYQERTRELENLYQIHPEYRPPQFHVVEKQNGENVWVVPASEEAPLEIEQFKVTKSTLNVPISGTELFQQKSEAQMKHAAEKATPRQNTQLPKTIDPQFGVLMHGNPNFIYPTYIKNGRTKEKRYKCHKCPSAFEKREQYKTHLSLHGAKQRYKCEHCDYSVKYYANYVQHSKKHQMNADAQALLKTPESCDEEIDSEESEGNDANTAKDMSLPKNGPLKLTTAEQQTLAILQQRRESSGSGSKDAPVEDKKMFWCASCPYTNYRKDAVDNHNKRHISVSGFANNYTCEHCDYSVPQAHFLRDHTKLHFTSNKMHQPEAFLICNGIKLTSKKVVNGADVGEDNTDEVEESLVFEDNSTNSGEGDRFLPPLNEDILERFNNNEGEKQFVNPETGEMVGKNAKKAEGEAGSGSLVKVEEN